MAKKIKKTRSVIDQQNKAEKLIEQYDEVKLSSEEIEAHETILQAVDIAVESKQPVNELVNELVNEDVEEIKYNLTALCSHHVLYTIKKSITDKDLDIYKNKFLTTTDQAYKLICVNKFLSRLNINSTLVEDSIEKTLNNIITNNLELKTSPRRGDLVMWLHKINSKVGNIGIVINVLQDGSLDILIPRYSKHGLTTSTFAVENLYVKYEDTTDMEFKGFVSLN